MNVLITGSSGFLGAWLIQYLRKHGHHTIGIDLKPPGFVPPDLFLQGDICDSDFMQRALTAHEAEAVVHLAAVSTIQAGQEDPERTWQVNVGGTELLLDLLDRIGSAATVLYASTDKVYGCMNGQDAYQEQTSGIHPVSYYAYDCSKAAADKLTLQWAADGKGGGAIVFRFCNLYGAYDRNVSRIVPGSISALLQGQSAVLRKYIDDDGRARNYYRDMLYVEDWAAAMQRVLEAVHARKHGHMLGKAYNLGSTGVTSMEEVMRELYRLVGAPFSPRIEYAGEPEIPIQHTDYSMAREAFDFRPAVSLQEGLRRTIDWWKQHIDQNNSYRTE